MANLAKKAGIVKGGGNGMGSTTANVESGRLVIGNRNAQLGERVVRAIDQARDREGVQVTDVSKQEVAQAPSSGPYRISAGWIWPTPGWMESTYGSTRIHHDLSPTLLSCHGLRPDERRIRRNAVGSCRLGRSIDEDLDSRKRRFHHGFH